MMYLRLMGKSEVVYKVLETLLKDPRKLAERKMDGSKEILG